LASLERHINELTSDADAVAGKLSTLSASPQVGPGTGMLQYGARSPAPATPATASLASQTQRLRDLELRVASLESGASSAAGSGAVRGGEGLPAPRLAELRQSIVADVLGQLSSQLGSSAGTTGAQGAAAAVANVEVLAKLAEVERAVSARLDSLEWSTSRLSSSFKNEIKLLKLHQVLWKDLHERLESQSIPFEKPQWSPEGSPSAPSSSGAELGFVRSGASEEQARQAQARGVGGLEPSAGIEINVGDSRQEQARQLRVGRSGAAQGSSG